MKNAKKLFWTTLLLTASSFAMKTVGVWFNVYLSARIGSAGIGLWNLILSVYFMLKTLSAAGMNLVSTRLVIDQPDAVNSSLRKLYVTALVPGCLGMAILFFGSDAMASRFIQSTDSGAPLRLLSLSLPFIAMSSCTGGYSTAKRKMGRYAVIQMAEQGVRIGISILALSYVKNGDLKTATLASALGITAGEMFSFFTGLLTVAYDRAKERDKKKTRGYLAGIKNIALPDAAGSIFRSLLSTLQNLLIPRGMKKNGASYEASLAAYGAVHGMALPVLLYPSSILGVLSGLLIPEIAQSKSKRHWGHIHYVIYRVLHLAVIFSLCVAGAMLGFSRELSLAVYGSEEAAQYILLLAPLVPVMYMDMTSDGLLKGLDMQKQIMAINVLDSVVSVVMIYFLVPQMGIYGYVFMVYFTELMNFILSFSCLIKKSRFSLKQMKPSLLGILLMPASVIIASVTRPFLSSWEPVSQCTAMIGIHTAAFLLLCFASGTLTKEDLHWFKKTVK